MYNYILWKIWDFKWCIMDNMPEACRMLAPNGQIIIHMWLDWNQTGMFHVQIFGISMLETLTALTLWQISDLVIRAMRYLLRRDTIINENKGYLRGGPWQNFLEYQIWALGTTGDPNNRENFWWSSGTSAPNRLRATPRPKIGRKIVISPRWS